MKLLPYLIILASIAVSCKVGNGDKNNVNEPESIKDPGEMLQAIVSEFPIEELDELVESISQNELVTVIADGQSEHWTSVLSGDKHELVIRNKSAADNEIHFALYQGNPIVAMIAVQQQNAQVLTTEVWEYWFKTSEENPDRWNQYLLPDYKLDSFFDERVLLPQEFQGKTAKPYLDYELGLSSITVSLNKWVLMRQLEGDSVSASGGLDVALIKYKYVLNWNGDDFKETQLKEAGYNDMLMFTSAIVEQIDGGPGPHEFDCPHGVSVRTSSTLNPQGKYDYKASNMLTPIAAWSEGVEGDGVGEWIEFTITSDFHIGDSWQMGNGNNRSKDVWNANNRIKKMKVLVDDKVIGVVILANVFTFQEFNIAPNWLKEQPAFRKGTKIRFIIDEVYKGSKYNDTVISYFVPTGNCG